MDTRRTESVLAGAAGAMEAGGAGAGAAAGGGGGIGGAVPAGAASRKGTRSRDRSIGTSLRSRPTSMPQGASRTAGKFSGGVAEPPGDLPPARREPRAILAPREPRSLRAPAGSPRRAGSGARPLGRSLPADPPRPPHLLPARRLHHPSDPQGLRRPRAGGGAHSGGQPGLGAGAAVPRQPQRPPLLPGERPLPRPPLLERLQPPLCPPLAARPRRHGSPGARARAGAGGGAPRRDHLCRLGLVPFRPLLLQPGDRGRLVAAGPPRRRNDWRGGP